VEFVIEQRIAIGNPPKEHKFDLASVEGKFVVESKNHSWTEGDNVPRAKMGFVNEAVFYLQHIPSNIYRFVVMRRDYNQRRNLTLAEYYYRRYHHLLNGVLILEIDVDAQEVRIVK